MKICVYAICKNEEKNIPSWVESMKEADEIYVLDTGSTDNSVKLLKKLGVHVKKKVINPWRFDVARNESLKMVRSDTDLYVCTDIDERFEKGWRQLIEENYTPEYTRISYTYNWSLKKDGSPATMFYLNKVHNKDYIWTHPVHEVLKCQTTEKELLIKDIVLNHYQDYIKSRKSYLPLLELSVKESPEDDRNMHYLGREYMYYKMYDKSIETLHKHLHLKSANWKDERSASMRYIARCYDAKNYYEESQFWYELALLEAPYLRESYVEYAFLAYKLKKYKKAIELLDEAFKIKEKSKTYINEEFAWDYHIYDLYAICSYFLGKKNIAKYYNDVAISLNPDDERLIHNALFYS